MARPRRLPEESERVSYFLPKLEKDILEAYCEREGLKLSDVLRNAASAFAEEIQAKGNMNKESRKLYEEAVQAFEVLTDPSQRYADDWGKKWEDAKAIFGKIAEQNERLARYLKDTYEEIGYDISQLTPKIGNMHLRVFLQYASCYGWLEQVVASLSRFANTTKKKKEEPAKGERS